MAQGGETNEKMREVWQVEHEASQCTAMENGSMGAESFWNCGCGGPADVDQAGANESCRGSTVRRSRQVFDHDDRTVASKC